MIVHEVTQGSAEWKALRLGIPTASEAHRLITPAKLLPAKWDLYLAQCLAESILGYPLDEGYSQWMERGTDTEDAAIAWYEFEHGVTVQRVGFITNDAGTFGCSPDGLIGDDEGLELKVPSAVNHVAYMLQPSSLYEKYKVQVQASLWVTGLKLWNLVSYNPYIEPVVYPVTPDEEFAEAFAPILNTFTIALEAHKADYRKRNPEPVTTEQIAEMAEVTGDGFFDLDDTLPF